VIIPFLEMDVSVGSGSAGRNNPYVLKQYQDRSLSLIQLKKEYGSYSDSLRHEYKKEYIKSLIGELNTLYVALTRAKDEMYVFVPEKAGKTNNLAGILFPFEKYESGKKRQYISDVQEETPAMMLAPSSYSDWISVLKSESINVSALLNKDKILKGEIFHYILSCIGNLSEEDKIESLEVAGLKTHLMFPYSGDLEGYFEVVERMIEDEDICRFFYVEAGTVYREKEIIDSSGNTKRVDRLIEQDGEAWIVDYKSSNESPEEYQEQIRGYIEVIKGIYPDRKVMGYLVYLDSLTVEEVSPEND